MASNHLPNLSSEFLLAVRFTRALKSATLAEEMFDNDEDAWLSSFYAKLYYSARDSALSGHNEIMQLTLNLQQV